MSGTVIGSVLAEIKARAERQQNWEWSAKDVLALLAIAEASQKLADTAAWVVVQKRLLGLEPTAPLADAVKEYKRIVAEVERLYHTPVRVTK